MQELAQCTVALVLPAAVAECLQILWSPSFMHNIAHTWKLMINILYVVLGVQLTSWKWQTSVRIQMLACIQNKCDIKQIKQNSRECQIANHMHYDSEASQGQFISIVGVALLFFWARNFFEENSETENFVLNFRARKFWGEKRRALHF